MHPKKASFSTRPHGLTPFYLLAFFFLSWGLYASVAFAIDHEPPGGQMPVKRAVKDVDRPNPILQGVEIKEDENDDALYVDEYAEKDPLEGFNRIMFEFNNALDKVFLQPAVVLYTFFIPQFFRDRVHDVIVNLTTPLTMINDLLQGEGENFLNSTVRFILNTTFGVFGLFDVASEIGLYPNKENFNQTLGSWGMESGPYLVLPVFGPSTFRGTIGLITDYFADPFNMWARRHNKKEAIWYRDGAQALDSRSRNYKMFDEMEADSLDYYATIRSLYFQHQLNQVSNDELDPEGDDAALESMETPIPKA